MVCELFHFYAWLVFMEKGKQTANITNQHEAASCVSPVIRNVCFNGWPNQSAVSYYFTCDFSEEKRRLKEIVRFATNMPIVQFGRWSLIAWNSIARKTK